MKKCIIFPVMAIMLLFGCNKEVAYNNAEDINDSAPVLKPIVFTSLTSDEGTKVAIDDYTLKFTEGDKIAVASYNFASETAPIVSDYATYDGSVPSTSGRFTPATSVYGATWAGTASAVSFYSFYPTTGAPTISGTTATVTNIAASQDGSLSSILCWAKGSNVATAAEVTDGNVPNFSFSPVCALLKLTIVNNDDDYDTSLSSIVLRASSGNKIAGSASLNLLTGSLSGGASTSITFTLGSTLELAKSGGRTTIYLSFIPTTIKTIDFEYSDTRSAEAINYGYTASLDKDFPATLLPGRLYERTLTISDIAPTSMSGSLGKYNGIKYVRGFLKRSTTSSTDEADMSISDATTNALEFLSYANVASSNDSYYMYFGWNELNTIFGGTANTSFIGNTITIATKKYKVPSLDDINNLVSTTRTSNAPTINSTEKAWSCVKVTLTDSKTAFGTDYYSKGFTSNNTSSNYIRGLLYFPDGASVTCSNFDLDKCNVFTAAVVSSPNTITSSQLKVLVNGGCLFIPFVGGHSKTHTWNSRGSIGYLWSSSFTTGCAIMVMSCDTPSIASSTYSGARHFPVALILDE